MSRDLLWWQFEKLLGEVRLVDLLYIQVFLLINNVTKDPGVPAEI